jgi:CubicO group peptidase (beta-lactamase class C family)
MQPEPFKVDAVRELRAYANEHMRRESLPALQLALSYGSNRLLISLGCQDTTRFCVFSVSKPLFASAVWRIADTAGFDLSASVGELVPSLRACPVGSVRLDHVMSHMGGFPNATADLQQLTNSRARMAAIAEWTLEWEPGSRFEYHTVSAHWVLATVLSALTGEEHDDAFHRLVTASLDLPHKILGVADPGDYHAPILASEVNDEDASSWEMLLSLGSQPAMSAGVPGAGCIMTAANVADVYQAFLWNPGGLWREDILTQATSEVIDDYWDDYAGVTTNRSVGFTIAGASDDAVRRGFGRRNSHRAFGHGGAGGQIAWADPATNLSFACVSNGLITDARRIEQFEVEISDLAIACL